MIKSTVGTLDLLSQLSALSTINYQHVVTSHENNNVTDSIYKQLLI